MRKNLVDLEHRLNYYFNDKNLLKQALIHKSYGNENRQYKNQNNERLELLGDAVLGLVVAEYLYQKYPHESEGSLAKAKAMIVSEPVLAKISKKMQVGDYLFLGKGEIVSGGRERASILGDAFESILGAIYLDSGFFAARDHVLFHLKEALEHIEHFEETIDFKTLLQEFCQKNFKELPSYSLLGEEGPDHRKNFEIEVSVKHFKVSAKGRNKKMAEQKAAKALCDLLSIRF